MRKTIVGAGAVRATRRIHVAVRVATHIEYYIDVRGDDGTHIDADIDNSLFELRVELQSAADLAMGRVCRRT
jgi:hypothetical protein